ncbi:hypothetical protein SERLA73DRAFT_182125 [Serpula lacrymans var. lacrymans S7.3]|uniref:PARP catalytic domain-containing protein n=2 Tax=Serpula lacrymans var. lacrymans TaxID=341189 RepID=F8PZB8_SERL3|nr:uncharacterized protein SERLADRAFT_468631 [Serpula lacrymans var. lacrymans S7.9]EGN99231.1 hypothetical protein SERLA73DRAFT_182125 [Serpula lacrymans var. lacrymans S7.3]EGO24799.1 hypothetical protein SERLADRAFT_468631 [Serpula lacrymans var. lacrymans S7.9]
MRGRGGFRICPPGGRRYNSVVNQFVRSWRHPPTQKPRFTRIVRVVQVKPPYHLRLRYNKFKSRLEKRGKFSRRRLPKGNERRRWHGTAIGNCQFLQPNLRRDGHCESSRRCIICSIINTGFRKPKPTPGRRELFGFGMYFSSTSSKSDDYTGARVLGMAKPAPGVRAILLCKVAVGRACKVRTAQQQRTRAPRGFNSVIGQPGLLPGLNYDELVTYNVAQNTPAFVIVYA